MAYPSLDAEVRSWMLRELERDRGNGCIYLSPRLTRPGRRAWPALLRQAVSVSDDRWLAAELRARAYLRRYETRAGPHGGRIAARVPRTAADTLAEGQFNRLYIRGVCASVLAAGGREVSICRGKRVRQPRPASQAVLDTRLPARALLDDLRRNPGAAPALGLPGPNSGLTVRRLGMGGERSRGH